jgi:hypothetical protein
MLAALRSESDARGMAAVEDDARAEDSIRPGPEAKAELLRTIKAEGRSCIDCSDFDAAAHA